MQIDYKGNADQILADLTRGHFCRPGAFNTYLSTVQNSLHQGFERLISLDNLDLELFAHQRRAVLTVLRRMRGRAILADEVGLGKTIEAGVILREYLVRNLVHRALILTPASLVTQWQEELAHRLKLPLHVGKSGDNWAAHPLLLTSLDTAKREENARGLAQVNWDLIIVDEAHRLKNRRTANWQLINQLQKKFLLLLTATPVQNNLRELFNLVTLVKPGQLSTYELFKQEFVINQHSPKNVKKLRELLSGVMVRTTRREATVTLPRREVQVIPVDFIPTVRQLYEQTMNLARRIFLSDKTDRNLLPLIVLLREATSSPAALAATLRRMLGQKRWQHFNAAIKDVLSRAESLSGTAKDRQVIEILRKKAGKVLVFTEFRATQAHLQKVLESEGFDVVLFHGGMNAREKDESVAAFSEHASVLISTEAGGEGRNLQFCQHLVNYDLPWNPMRIEQRIGRVHRLGQRKAVHIFNLVARQSIEEHVYELLARKIGLFLRVIGELDAILTGYGEHNLELEIGKAVLSAEDLDSARQSLNELGARLGQAAQSYERTRKFNTALLGEKSLTEAGGTA